MRFAREVTPHPCLDAHVQDVFQGPGVQAPLKSPLQLGRNRRIDVRAPGIGSQVGRAPCRIHTYQFVKCKLRDTG